MHKSLSPLRNSSDQLETKKNVKYLTAASKKIEIYRHTPNKVWLRFVYWNL